MNLINHLKNLFKKKTPMAKSLKELEEDFNKKRFEYRSTLNIWYTVAVALISIGIFFYVFNFFLDQSSSQDIVATISSKLLSKEFLNNEFASAISLSASFALVIPILYTIGRVMRTQKRNAEISNLNLQIRNERSRIIQQKQEEITQTDEDIKTNISADIEKMLDLLISTGRDYVANPELQNSIDAIRSKYSDYEVRAKYRYARAFGVAFSRVNHALLAFMNLRPIPPPPPPAYNYDKEQVQNAIALLKEALFSLKTLKGGTNP
jgi:hypothetical protein